MVSGATINVMTEQTDKRWKQFGTWLSQQRKQVKKSQKEVALSAGLHVVQLSRIENGESGTKKETLDALIKALRLDPGEAYRQAGFMPASTGPMAESDNVIADRTIQAINVFRDLTTEQRRSVLISMLFAFDDMPQMVIESIPLIEGIYSRSAAPQKPSISDVIDVDPATLPEIIKK